MNEEYEYCNFANGYNSIKEILSIAFEINDFKPIEDAYTEFEKNFGMPGSEKLKTIVRQQMVPKTRDTIFLNHFNSDKQTVGIDLPVLISSKESKGVIFILGEDPLRNDNYENENKVGSIILSTPYGIHFEKCRKGRQKIYWLISELILKMGYSLYYTDVNKIWIKRNYKDGEKETIP